MSNAASYQAAFELSPIFMIDGIAPNGAMAISQLINQGLTTTTQDAAFAHFYPMANSTLVDQEVATYPFANQATAANATITQPLHISFLMQCPVRGNPGYWGRQGVMTNLQNQLVQHNSLGGTYNLLTPSFIYTGCVMRSMRDVSSGESRQPQITWQLDFMQPLVSEDATAQAFNALLSKLEGQTQLLATQGVTPPQGAPNPAALGSTAEPTATAAPGAANPAAGGALPNSSAANQPPSEVIGGMLQGSDYNSAAESAGALY